MTTVFLLIGISENQNGSGMFYTHKGHLMNTFYNAEETSKEKTSDSANDQLMQKFLNTRQIILSGEVNKELAEKVIRFIRSVWDW